MESAQPNLVERPRIWRQLDNGPRQDRSSADFAVLQNAEAEIVVSQSSNRRSFVVLIQDKGEGIVTHGPVPTPIASGEIVVMVPRSDAVWRQAGAGSSCVIVSGGPAFSLRFQPRAAHIAKLGRDHSLTPLLNECSEKLADVVPAANARTTQKLAEVFAHLVDIAIDEVTESSSARKLINKLTRCEAYLDNPDFDPAALAAGCGITLRSLQKRLKACDTSPRQWILQRRLERIRLKLDDPLLANLTIRQIATRGGFQDYSYFCRSFKEAFAVTPGQYRR